MQVIHRPFQWGGVRDDVEAYLWSCLNRSGTVKNVVDIGARHTLSPRVFDISTSISLYEPMPMYYNELKESYGNYVNVTIYPYGVGDKNETIPFYPNTESFIKRTVHTQSKDPIMLPMKTFEDAMKESNNETIDFMKIDAEGYDYYILKNAKPYIDSKKIKYIQFEIGGTFFDMEENLFDMFNLFDSDWRIYNMEPNGILNLMTEAFTWDASDYSNSNLFATWIPENELKQILS